MRYAVLMFCVLGCAHTPVDQGDGIDATGIRGPDDGGSGNMAPNNDAGVVDAAPGVRPDPPPRPAVSCPEESLGAIAREFGEELDRTGVPGGALVIVCEGRIALSEAFGVRRAGGGPVTPQTRFQLASTTKMFTGALGVSLDEAGVFNLRDPIGEHLPNVGFRTVTVHDLLSHTSGFATEFTDHGPDLLTVVQDNSQMPLWAPPGRVWNYSNPGYAIAGAVMQLAAGRSFAQLVEQLLFAPSNMTRATFDIPALIADGDFAYGHEENRPPLGPNDSYYEFTSYHPMGGAWGSAEDLARWGIAHMTDNPDVLSRAGWDRVRTAHSGTSYVGTHYGYGHFVEPDIDPLLVRHSGSVPGFIAGFRVFPEVGFGIFGVVNAGWFFPGDVLYNAGQQLVSPRVTDTVADLRPTEAYVGVYEDPHELGIIEITADGRDLSARFVDRGYTSVMHFVGDDTFYVELQHEGFEVEFRFWPGENGQLQYFASIFGVAAR